jgi:hypothetical protein
MAARQDASLRLNMPRILYWLQNLTSFKLWLLTTALSIAATELITCGMELLLKHEISYDYLLTGFIASLLVAAVVVVRLTSFTPNSSVRR